MRKPGRGMIGLTVVLAAACFHAQSQQTDPDAAGAPGNAGMHAGKTSVEGCLQGSNGNFTLTDSTGTTYKLQGNTAPLSEHVGQQVQITGAASELDANNATSGGASPANQQTLRVENVKPMAKTCPSSRTNSQSRQ